MQKFWKSDTFLRFAKQNTLHTTNYCSKLLYPNFPSSMKNKSCSALHFLIYTIAVVIPSILGLIMAVVVWRALVRQIDSIVKV